MWDADAFAGKEINLFHVTGLDGTVPLPPALSRLGESGLKFLLIQYCDQFGHCKPDVEPAEIGADELRGFRSLEYLSIAAPIRKIDPLAFEKLESLRFVEMRETKLATFPQEAFSRLSKLIELNFLRNNVTSFPANSFERIKSLNKLWIAGVDLNGAIANGALDNLPPSLFQLRLESVKLRSVPTRIFPKSQLSILSLQQNDIEMIKQNDFKALSSTLISLTITGNPLKSIESGSFESLGECKRIYIDANKIQTFDLSLLKGMYKLEAFVLYGDEKSELNLSVTNVEHVAETLFLMSLRYVGFSYISPQVERIVERKNFKEFDISGGQIPCDKNVHWMAKYALCAERRIVIDSFGAALCTDGTTLRDYLKAAVPNACDGTFTSQMELDLPNKAMVKAWESNVFAPQRFRLREMF